MRTPVLTIERLQYLIFVQRESNLQAIYLSGGGEDMSPEHAKVLIAEDDPLIVKDMEFHLGEAGHDVVRKSATLKEAQAMISQIPALEKQYGAEKIIVVLGGNLGEWKMPEDRHNDSQVLLRLLKEQRLAFREIVFPVRLWMWERMPEERH